MTGPHKQPIRPSPEPAQPAAADLVSGVDELLGSVSRRLRVALAASCRDGPTVTAEIGAAATEADAARVALRRLGDALVDDGDDIAGFAAFEIDDGVARLARFLLDELRGGTRHSGASLYRARAAIGLPWSRISDALAKGQRCGLIVRIPFARDERRGGRANFLYPLVRLRARGEKT